MIQAILAAALMVGCEKFDPNEFANNTNSTENDEGTEWGDEIIPEPTGTNLITVAEAIEAPLDSFIYVQGYIIGSTLRSMKNAIYKPPFESRSSLILSDVPFKESQGFYDDEFLPVRLTDFPDYQRALNLVDHPEHWNKRVNIYAMKCTYLGVPGLKIIEMYEFVE